VGRADCRGRQAGSLVPQPTHRLCTSSSCVSQAPACAAHGAAAAATAADMEALPPAPSAVTQSSPAGAAAAGPGCCDGCCWCCGSVQARRASNTHTDEGGGSSDSGCESAAASTLLVSRLLLLLPLARSALSWRLLAMTASSSAARAVTRASMTCVRWDGVVSPAWPWRCCCCRRCCCCSLAGVRSTSHRARNAAVSAARPGSAYASPKTADMIKSSAAAVKTGAVSTTPPACATSTARRQLPARQLRQQRRRNVCRLQGQLRGRVSVELPVRRSLTCRRIQ
jgi:hypothetical protein